MKRIVGIYIAWLIAAVMLVSAATGRHPYSFYMLLRWICCPIFAYSAFAAYEKTWVLWFWVFGVLAALYNPIFRVHLDRTSWIGVNWFTVGVIVVAAAVFWRKQAQCPLRLEEESYNRGARGMTQLIQALRLDCRRASRRRKALYCAGGEFAFCVPRMY